MSHNPVARIRFLAVCVFMLAALCLARLFFVQVVRGEEYSDSADRQYLRSSSHVYDRGTIYFSEKDGKLVSAATLKLGYLVAINPEKIEDPELAYEKLSSVIPLEREDFIERAGKRNDPYEEIASRLDQATADKIKALEIKGVYIYKERWRYYPADRLAAHVLGFVGYQGDTLAGRYGLEMHYDDVLSRNDGLTFVNFFAEIFSGLGNALLEREDRGEGDVVMTIEPKVQGYLERQLAEIVEKHGAEAAGGIVMDPKTGEIAAMAALPNFHPGEKQTDVAVLANPLVENVYEMGSIVKPLTVAAAIDAGAVTAKTTYEDVGRIVLNGKPISNYDGRARGVVDMQEVLNQSLNLGVTFAVQRMGKDSFREYMHAFGLGEKTGIDLPGEVPGLVKNLESNREVEHATASFGQGIAVSPVAITRALATLANGGYLVTPHVTKRIDYETMLSRETKIEPGRRVLKQETSDEISRMLAKVVDDALVGGKAKLPHHTVGAKTGTAQMAAPGGGYYADRYLHSFFGYVPAYDARFITFLYVIDPKGVRYASETLTSPFMNISKFLINYYEIPPDR